MSFKMTSQQESDHWLISLKGDLDIYATESFKKDVEALTQAQAMDLVMDASDLSYLDSMGIGILMAIYHDQEEKGYGLRLKNLKPHIKKLFVITELDELFQIGG